MKRFFCVLLILSFSAGVWAQADPWKRKWNSIRRLEPERLQAAHEDAGRLQASRVPVALSTSLNDYKCILHAHAEDSAHTGGTRPEMLADAKNSAADIARRAKVDIEQAKDIAVNEIHKRAVELSYSITEKLIKKSLNKEDYERLVQETIERYGDLN